MVRLVCELACRIVGNNQYRIIEDDNAVESNNIAMPEPHHQVCLVQKFFPEKKGTSVFCVLKELISESVPLICVDRLHSLFYCHVHG